MSGKQDLWESLQRKYEQRNRELLKREAELRYRLEAMNSVIGDGRRTMNQPQPPPYIMQPPAPQYGPELLSYSPPRAADPQINKFSMPHVPEQPQYPPDFKNCACQPPQEKGGFFKCLTSILPTLRRNNSPTAAPAVPDSSTIVPSPATDGPTPYTAPPTPSFTPMFTSGGTSALIPLPPMREGEIVTHVEPKIDKKTPTKDNMTVYKNENCICAPCPVDVDTTPQKDDDDNYSLSICNCTICVDPTDTKNVKTSQQKDDMKTDSVCNCSICSKTDNPAQGGKTCCCNMLDVDVQNTNVTQNKITTVTNDQKDDDFCLCSVCSKISGNKDGLCCCNLDLLAEGRSPPGRQKGDGLLNKMSLKSLDLYYMKNVHDLATRQKTLQNNVEDLEKKAKIYEEIFNQYKGINLDPQGCPCSNVNGVDPDQKTNAELKLENFLLKSELKDMRLEVRQYLERMEGPMQFKIESERYKNNQLEQKLEQAAKELAETQELFQKELNALKMQLCTANTNVYNLTSTNQQLTDELQNCKKKCTQLEEDLIRQKISEAESLKALQNALKQQSQQPQQLQQPCPEECNLHQIARELSSILKECEPCGQCISLPDDLTTAAKLLKSLTDMIDEKLPKDEETERDRKNLDTKASSVQKDVEVVKDAGIEKRPSEAKGAPEQTADEPKVEDQKEPISTKQSETKKSESSMKGSLEVKQSETEKSQKSSKGSISVKISETEKSQKSSKGSINVKISETEKSQKSSKGSIDVKASETEKSQKSSKGSVNVKISETEKSQKSEKEASLDPKPSESEKSQKSATKSSLEEKESELQKKQSLDAKSSEKSADKSQKESVISTEQKPSILQKTSKTLDPQCKCSLCPADEVEIKKSKSCKCVEFTKPVAQEMESKESSGSEKKPCKCSNKKSTEKVKEFIPAAFVGPATLPGGKKPCPCNLNKLDTKPVPTSVSQPTRPSDGVDQLWPKQGIPSSTNKEIVKSQPATKQVNVKGNFPYKIDTHVDIIDKPPDGVHVTTTITNSGVLEVVTEGPEGFIETTLIYTPSGNVEVATEILEYNTKGATQSNRGTIKATSQDARAIEDSPRASRGSCSKALPSSEMCRSCRMARSQNQILQGDGSFVNPNCRCKPCVALEGGLKSDQCPCASCPKQKPVPETKQAPPEESAPKTKLPENCKCVSCLTQTEEPPPKTAKQGLPEDCKCVSCLTQTEETAPKPEKRAGLPEDCRCVSCPPPTDTTETKQGSPASDSSGKCICSSCLLPSKTTETKQESKEDTAKHTSGFKLPDDCKCASCIPSESTAGQIVKEDPVKAVETVGSSSTKPPGDCSCKTCTH